MSALQVHLLTALVDDLTAEASAPVDRLAGAALAVSKAELGERIQQQSNFELQADELKARVARVRTHASKAVENSRHTSKVRYVRVTGDFIDRLTPQVIAAARALAGEISYLLASVVTLFCRNSYFQTYSVDYELVLQEKDVSVNLALSH